MTPGKWSSMSQLNSHTVLIGFTISYTGISSKYFGISSNFIRMGIFSTPLFYVLWNFKKHAMADYTKLTYTE